MVRGCLACVATLFLQQHADAHSRCTRAWYFAHRVGPSINFLIKFGAKATPCMREDAGIATTNEETRLKECGVMDGAFTRHEVFVADDCPGGKCITNACPDRATPDERPDLGMSCCNFDITAPLPRVGMTTLEECWEYPNSLYHADHTQGYKVASFEVTCDPGERDREGKKKGVAGCAGVRHEGIACEATDRGPLKISPKPEVVIRCGRRSRRCQAAAVVRPGRCH